MLEARASEAVPAAFPPTLREIADPELRALLARLDPTPDSVAGTGTRDWSDLDQRIHFITDLVRCYHDSPELFHAP